MLCSAVGVSYNLPKLCPSATWDPNGIVWTNSTQLSASFAAAFVDTNNTVYIAGWPNGHIYIWFEGNMSRPRVLSTAAANAFSLFVTSAGEIFADRGSAQIVQKVTSNGTTTTVMEVSASCLGLFVAVNHDIYCSINALHQVVKKSLENEMDDSSIIAGTGCPGSAPNTLNAPQGIFVDLKLSLYVADTNNDRIQFFLAGQTNGTTLVGGTRNKSIELSQPTSVVLDAEGSLFIADFGNHRIVASGANGSRCIVGCERSSGIGAYSLWNPRTIHFDRDGNIFVIDLSYTRMQKFFLAKNSCGKDLNTED